MPLTIPNIVADPNLGFTVLARWQKDVNMCDAKEEPLWYALQVTPRKENTVAALLTYKGYEPFVPACEVDRHTQTKLKPIEKLFPGYVFCRFVYSKKSQTRNGGGVVTTPGVIRILGGIKPAPIPLEEIEAIRLALAAKLQPQSWPFQSGQKIKITAGPLRGISGLVMRSDGRHRLVLSVELLRRAVAATVEAEWVTPTVCSNEA